MDKVLNSFLDDASLQEHAQIAGESWRLLQQALARADDHTGDDCLHLPDEADRFAVDVAWAGSQPLLPGRNYRIVTAAGRCRGLVGRLKHRLAAEGHHVAARTLEQGHVGRVEVELERDIPFGGVMHSAPLAMMAFLDEIDGSFLGLGIIRFALRRASNIRWQPLRIGKRERALALGQKPFVLWFTGLSGSGKSSVAALLEERLYHMGWHTCMLDGDNVRHGLCVDLGFTEADRVENLRRVTEVAKLMVEAGLIVIVAFISPFRHERLRARQSFDRDEFLEVFMDTPLEVCEARDVKGLYAKARAGLIRNFTGIDSPYEPPENPEIHLHGDLMQPREMVDVIIEELKRRGLLEPPAISDEDDRAD